MEPSIFDDFTNFVNDNLPFVLVGGFFIWYLFLRGGAGNAASKVVGGLYLDKYIFNRNKRRGIIVEIRGRKPGLMGWILSLFGLNRQSFIIVTDKEVRFHFTGISDTTTYVAPLNTVTCFLSGKDKPLGRAIIGGLLIFVGIAGLLTLPQAGLPFLIVGSLFILSYVFTTRLMLGFSTGDVTANYGLNFRTKTRGGDKLSAETLEEMINHINRVFRHAERQSEVKDVKDDIEYDEIIPQQPAKLTQPSILHELDLSELLGESDDEPTLLIDDINLDQLYNDAMDHAREQRFQDAIANFTIVINRTEAGSGMHLDALRSRAMCHKHLGNASSYKADKAEWNKYTADAV